MTKREREQKDENRIVKRGGEDVTMLGEIKKLRAGGPEAMEKYAGESEREIVDLGGGSRSVRGLLGERRHIVGHGRGGNVGLLGLEPPSADVGIPPPVVLARLDVDGDAVSSALAQLGGIVGPVEERDANLARELPAVVVLEDDVLTLPLAAGGSTLGDGHYFVNGSFKFHKCEILFNGTKVAIFRDKRFWGMKKDKDPIFRRTKNPIQTRKTSPSKRRRFTLKSGPRGA